MTREGRPAQKVRGGWYADAVSQKAEWTQAITALDLTERQKRGLIEVLQFFREGEVVDEIRLRRHENQLGKSRPTRWRSRWATHQFLDGLQKRKVVSARYGWHLVVWLKRNGWIADQEFAKGTRKVQGYRLSADVLIALCKLAASVEHYWGEPE